MKRTNLVVSEIVDTVGPGAKRTEALRWVAMFEKDGYDFGLGEASLRLLIYRKVRKHRLPFTVSSYSLSMRGEPEGKNVCEATVKIEIKDLRSIHEASEGDGPIHALDGAMRKGLSTVYPVLRGVRLVDYNVWLLKGDSGVDSRTSVCIESTDGDTSWRTIGVHQNVVVASLQALVDGFEYSILRPKLERKREV